MDNIEKGMSSSISMGSSSGNSNPDFSLESLAHLEGQKLLDAVGNDEVWEKLSKGM